MAKPDDQTSDSDQFEAQAFQTEFCKTMSRSLSSIIVPTFKLFKQYEEGTLTIAQQ